MTAPISPRQRQQDPPPFRFSAFIFTGVLCLCSVGLNVYLLHERNSVNGESAVTNSLQDFSGQPSRRRRARKQESRHEFKFDPTPPTVAACLLIKDDNDILSEWIAYHYHTLNLTSLVVAVDPSSATSPSPILDAWREYIHINVWHDRDFMPKKFIEKGYHIPPRYLDGDASKSQWHQGTETYQQVIADKLKIENHRFRQITFLSHCLRYFKEKHDDSDDDFGHPYVLHIDTDEYVVINPVLRQRLKTQDSKQKERKGEIVASSGVAFSPSTCPREKGCMWNFLHGMSPGQRHSANLPCISMPRLLFGSYTNEKRHPQGDSSATDQLERQMLETSRWRYHTTYNDTERNAQPKVLVDVSQVPLDDEMFSAKPFSIHRPSKALCRRLDQLNFTFANRYPLAVHHYLGTRERYMARNDTRRSTRVYDSKANVRAGYEDWIVSWYDGFVQSMGTDVARRLLFGHKQTGKK